MNKPQTKKTKNMEFLKLLEENDIGFEIKENRLIVYDYVYLSNSELKEFPNYPMEFTKGVNLSHTQIRGFPDYPIVFYGDVDLSHTQIKEFLNHPLIFWGSLNLSHTQIKKFPNCPRIFYGYLSISHTQIKELPDCIIRGYLDIRGTTITKIPKNLKAYRIYTPINSELYIYIEKNGIIVIGEYGKIISEWEEFFKEREPFDNNPDLTPEDYDLVEQDFKTAVKLYESWNS